MMIIGIVITTVNNGCVLITLDFLLFDHAFFLLTNLFKQTLAGSSLGSCGTSFPCIAHCNMLFFNYFPFIFCSYLSLVTQKTPFAVLFLQ